MRLARSSLSFLLALCVGAPLGAQPQSPRPMQSEEGMVVAAAIDFFLRASAETAPDTIRNPRLLRTLYLRPFDALVSRRAQPISQLDEFVDHRLNRLRNASTVVDSAEVVGRDDQLLPGGPLIILAPVSWRGDSVAVVRLAIYQGSLRNGAEAFVRVELRDGGWRGIRFDYGRIH